MAAANAKFTINPYPTGIDNTQREVIVKGTVAFDASPATYTTGGAPAVNALNTALSAWAQEGIKATQATATTPALPYLVLIIDLSGSGYVYNWNKTNNAVQVFQSAAENASAAPLAELTTAAIPAGVSGATLAFIAFFGRI